MNPAIIKLVVFLFEQLPLLNWFNGRKRTIGKAVTVTGLAIEIAKQVVPANPYLEAANGVYTAVIGSTIWGAGELHAKVKLNKEQE